MKDERFSRIGDSVKINRAEIDERFKQKLNDVRHEWSRGDNGIRRSRLYFEDGHGYYLLVTIEPIVDPKDPDSVSSSLDIPNSNEREIGMPSPAHGILDDMEEVIRSIRNGYTRPADMILLTQRMVKLSEIFASIVEVETEYPRITQLSIRQ